MVEVREVLRAWLEGHGLRRVAEWAGVDRKTARRYVAAAEAAGLTRDAGVSAVTDDLVGAVVEGVRPVRPNGHGASWEALLAHEEQVRAWVVGGDGTDPPSIVKTEELLAPAGREGAAPCTGSRWSGAGSGLGRPRSVWSMVSRGWSASSTSPSSDCWRIPRPGSDAGCTR